MNNEHLKLCDFSHEVYREYKDLKSMTNEELENHFFSFGIKEGRTHCHIKGEKEFTDLISNSGKMLEIGPLDRPQLNYDSPDYYSVDVFTKD